MHQYTYCGQSTAYTYVVGWDTALHTFYAQVVRPEDPDTDAVFCVLGTEPEAISSITQLQRIMAQSWDAIPAALVRQLVADHHAATPPTSLQEELQWQRGLDRPPASTDLAGRSLGYEGADDVRLPSELGSGLAAEEEACLAARLEILRETIGDDDGEAPVSCETPLDHFARLVYAHDLTYQYSDDRTVRRRGQASLQQIMTMAQTLPYAAVACIWNRWVETQVPVDHPEYATQWYWHFTHPVATDALHRAVPVSRTGEGAPPVPPPALETPRSWWQLFQCGPKAWRASRCP